MDHPETRKALIDADADIKFMIDTIQSDFILMTFGDHGTRREGGHGGETKEELESGLFAYSKKGFTFREFNNPKKLPLHKQELLKILGSAFDANFLNRKELRQVDDVPTVAAILNLPIPFCNQGIIMPEVLHYDCNVADCLYQLFMEHILNYVQVMNYAETYVSKYGQMHNQKVVLDNTFQTIKQETIQIIKASNKILDAERDHVKGTKMNEQTKIQYINFVKDMFNTMNTVRTTLRANKLAFDKQRYYFDKTYLYFGYTIQILVTICLLLGFILLSISDKVPVSFNHVIIEKYPSLILIVLFMIIFFNLDYAGYFFVLVFGLCLWCIISLGKICWNYKNAIRELIVEEKYWISVVLSVGTIVVIWVYFMKNGHDNLPILRTGFYIITSTNLLLFLRYDIRNLKHIMAAASFIVFGISYEYCYVNHHIFLADSYLVCSILPTILFLILGLYIIIKRLSRDIYPRVRLAFALTLILSTIGMFYYQIGELDDSFKNNYFTCIVVPRFIFSIALFQMIYLTASLFANTLLWRSLPSKKEGILVFFTLLLTSTVPSLFMIAGPRQQIYFFLMTLMCCLLNYMFNKIGLRNSFYFYTFYTFTTFFFYMISGHEFNYLYLRYNRVHVGFPERNFIIDSILIFFETSGIFSYMMAILPLVTLLNELNDNQSSSYAVMEIATESYALNKEKKEVKEDNALEITIIRNYLMVLLNLEILHNGMTIHLVINFAKFFTHAVPCEIMFRSLNCFIYILVIVSVFIINKI